MNKKSLLKWTSIVLGILFIILIGVSFLNNETIMNVFSYLFAIAFIVDCVFLILYLVEKKKNNPKPKTKKEKTKPTKQVGIKKVRILGVRTGEETGILATWNFALYSLLVIYNDGRKEVLELKSDSKLFKDLLPYLEDKDVEKVRQGKPFSDEEIDTYDITDKD